MKGIGMRQILFNTDMVRAYPEGWWFRGRVYANRENAMNSVEGVMRLCKYRPGDILWVRETWAEMPHGFVYRADDETPEGWHLTAWKPSIHMPREAARIFLRVTNVQVERLQQITNEDVGREGITPRWYGGGCKCSAYEPGCMDERCENREAYERMCYGTPFLELWDRTVKPADLPAYGWYANPWVWVISFERINKEKAQELDNL